MADLGNQRLPDRKTPMDNYYGNANPDLLAQVPVTAQAVLESGVGEGALGAKYLHINPTARYYGIETNPMAAETAGRRLTRVWTADCEAFDPEQLPEPPDCLVYGDVLEHLLDPWALLRRQAQILLPHGSVSACIPNAAHWSVALEVLRGRFPYHQDGIFDRTHLRWFNLDGMARLFRAAGLEIVRIVPRVFQPEAAEALVQRIGGALRDLGIDTGKFLRTAQPLQYVLQATKQPVPRIFLRFALPAAGARGEVAATMRQLRSIPGVQPLPAGSVAQVGNAPTPADTDLLILPLDGSEEPEALARQIARADKPVVVRIDRPLPAAERYIPLLHAASGIEVASRDLADWAGRQNPSTQYFPPAIDRLDPLPEPEPGHPSRVVIGTFGGEAGLGPFAAALDNVRAMHPEVEFCPVNAADLTLSQHDKQVAARPSDRADLDALEGAEIAVLLAGSDASIVECERVWLEAARRGAVVLADHTACVGCITDGTTGLLFADADMLAVQLRRLLRNAELRTALRLGARQYLMEQRMLAQQIAARLSWYASLTEKRGAPATSIAAPPSSAKRSVPD